MSGGVTSSWFCCSAVQSWENERSLIALHLEAKDVLGGASSPSVSLCLRGNRWPKHFVQMSLIFSRERGLNDLKLMLP